MKEYAPSSDVLENVEISEQQYDEMYQQSIEQPEAFWAAQAERISWFKTPSIIKNTSFTGDVSIKWYEDGVLNACYNCVDRHVEAGHGDDIAFIFEGDNPAVDSTVTYAELKEEVSRLANALKALGVARGDRVIIYMPMILQASYAMLACARLGAIHSVVFGGFSATALNSRIEDCAASLVITADEGFRGGKSIPLKDNVDEAVKGTPGTKVLVYQHTGKTISWEPQRDVWWHEACHQQSTHCPCEPMMAEDPLFILYTSGSTGKPKGVLHTTGGYMVYASLTHGLVFDYKPGEIYWCTADVGWITGHSYILYGPLANRATSLIFEGVPNYPDWSRFWQVVDKHHVNIFYTAPTVIRSLLREGDHWVERTSRRSLRLLGTVGEPINHEAWVWYHQVIGDGRCPIMDTWWQTETGGHMVTPLPCHKLKPGKAQKPFFGVKPGLVDGTGALLHGEAEGNFVMLDSWPGQMRTLYGDHQRFIQTYFAAFPGLYFSGDGAMRDADGDYRITGRVDDIVNVSGHRLGTAEIENAINEHPLISESAIVGFPHEVKGQGLYGFLVVSEGASPSPQLEQAVNDLLRSLIGPIARLDVVQFTDGLPKTRSGKIMRRILRKIAGGEYDQLGDISTLADPTVVTRLIEAKSAG